MKSSKSNGTSVSPSSESTSTAELDLVANGSITEERPTPRHVAIIMDGNGRWATKRGLSRLAGHDAGTENIRRITTKAVDLGIQYLTLWAFSTENWRRPADEVEHILHVLSDSIGPETEALDRSGAQLRHIGSLDELAPGLRDAIHASIAKTHSNDKIVLTIAFNYGGRAEILRAVKRMLADQVNPEDVDERLFASYLYTCDLPEPDLIIRTSGEMRISNFLLWQAAYAEWYFTPTLWPDFGPSDLDAAVSEFRRRDRRFGGLAK